MTAMDEVVNLIMQDIKPLPEGPFGEAFIDDILEQIPDYDIFFKPAPDVVDDLEKIPANMAKCLLGAYVPMSSPGQIALFSNNLRVFFWGLVRDSRMIIPKVTKADLAAGVRFVILKTYFHEQFHFGCDVLRGLLGGSLEPEREEALAVAWARLKLMQDRSNWQSQIGRMNGVFYGFLMEAAFRYRSDGYRDWPNYADDVRFKAGLVDYVQPGDYLKLMASGVAVGDLLYGMLENAKGDYSERML